SAKRWPTPTPKTAVAPAHRAERAGAVTPLDRRRKEGRGRVRIGGGKRRNHRRARQRHMLGSSTQRQLAGERQADEGVALRGGAGAAVVVCERHGEGILAR